MWCVHIAHPKTCTANWMNDLVQTTWSSDPGIPASEQGLREVLTLFPRSFLTLGGLWCVCVYKPISGCEDDPVKRIKWSIERSDLVNRVWKHFTVCGFSSLYGNKHHHSMSCIHLGILYCCLWLFVIDWFLLNQSLLGLFFPITWFACWYEWVMFLCTYVLVLILVLSVFMTPAHLFSVQGLY